MREGDEIQNQLDNHEEDRNPQGRGETILLIDDEEQIVLSSSRLLQRTGYHVLAAYNGRDGVEIFRQNQDRISLVILDMTMPGMSGGQTFDALRAIEPTVKVLLASGFNIEGEATDILQRGCNSFIQKPFDLTELLDKINKMR